mgnify:CR=1 FL=1|jgi:V8-like Glu-specific endopeptidase
MKRFALAVVLLLSSYGILDADTLDSYNSVCTIHVELEKSWTGGTGFVYKEDKNFFYVMTAGHVIDGCIKNYCLLHFFNNGKAVDAVQGEISKKDYNKSETIDESELVRDIAILKVKKTDFKNFQPTIIPLAPANKRIAIDETVFSLGCPNLRWPSAFLGSVNHSIPERFFFSPDVIGGRSGSPVYDKNCTMVIGVVIWSTPNGGCAISPLGISRHDLD